MCKFAGDGKRKNCVSIFLRPTLKYGDRQKQVDGHKIKTPSDWNMCCEGRRLGAGMEMDMQERATLDRVVREASAWRCCFS